MRGRCQICGRRLPLKTNGRVAHHHVRGEVCPGKNHLPLEQDDRHLEAEIARFYAISRSKAAFVRELLARRVNYIDPTHQATGDAAWSLARKLERRLARHRNWPRRFLAEMDRQGWGSPPPAYLLERIAA